MGKLWKWKKFMELKGLRVNIGKMKVMRCQVRKGQPEDSGKYPWWCWHAHLQVVCGKILHGMELMQRHGVGMSTKTRSSTLSCHAVAPVEMLNMICYKCKTDCSSVLCSCRKNGLKCVIANSNCCGQGCTNVEPVSNLEVNGDTDNELFEMITIYLTLTVTLNKFAI